jgi:radical SAM protein with 4Fe4S-binding SPASM domain
MRDLSPTEFVVPDLPPRYLFDLRTECNLACPMCLLHGAPDSPEKEAAIGKMSVDAASQLLDEIMSAKPMIQPAMWGEPTLAKDFKEHIAAMRSRGIAVAMNTNGLTFREPLARFLVEQKVDAVFFSLDATTPETLRKVRGIYNLDKIAAALKMLLRVRGEMGSIYPRVGATFTIQEANKHELEEFVDYWITVADLVRTGYVYEGGRLSFIEEPPERKPCAMIWDTMPIHYDGDVSLCCFDSHKQAVMGNVFKDGGVKAVWHNEKYQEVRRHHLNGEFDKVPFCKGCNAWVGRQYQEEISERNGVKVLIRRSPQFAYYNRVDRLDSWHKQLTGHKSLECASV